MTHPSGDCKVLLGALAGFIGSHRRAFYSE
jgi:hypothetical protein